MKKARREVRGRRRKRLASLFTLLIQLRKDRTRKRNMATEKTDAVKGVLQIGQKRKRDPNQILLIEGFDYRGFFPNPTARPTLAHFDQRDGPKGTGWFGSPEEFTKKYNFWPRGVPRAPPHCKPGQTAADHKKEVSAAEQLILNAKIDHFGSTPVEYFVRADKLIPHAAYAEAFPCYPVDVPQYVQYKPKSNEEANDDLAKQTRQKNEKEQILSLRSLYKDPTFKEKMKKEAKKPYMFQGNLYEHRQLYPGWPTGLPRSFWPHELIGEEPLAKAEREGEEQESICKMKLLILETQGCAPKAAAELAAVLANGCMTETPALLEWETAECERLRAAFAAKNTKRDHQ